MSAHRIQPRFAIGETVWAVNPYGSIISGHVTDVADTDSAAVHHIAHGGVEVFAHPCFAAEAEALEYRANEVEAELYTLRSRLLALKGGE